MDFIQILSEVSPGVKVKQFDTPLIDIVIYWIGSESNILPRDKKMQLDVDVSPPAFSFFFFFAI